MNRENVAEYIGNIDDKYLEEVFQHKGQSRRIIMSKKKLAAVIAAAAVIVLMTVGVAAAVAYMGLISEQEAFHAAENYVVMSEMDENIKDNLGAAVVGGLVYDNDISVAETDLGLSAGRFVYNVSFKTGGYSFKVMVDAKTGVVLKCDREVDENWDDVYDELKEEADKRLEELKAQNEREQAELAAKMPKIPDTQLREIFIDHFGIHGSLRSKESFSESPWLRLDGDSSLLIAGMTIDGYIYTCLINGDTGEVSDDKVVEDPDYIGERHLYQHIDGIISLYEAVKLGEQTLGVTEADYEYGYASAAYYPADLYYIDYDIDIINVLFVLNDIDDEIEYGERPRYTVVLNAKTGEVIEIIEKLNFLKAISIVQEATDIPKYNSSLVHENDNGQYEVRILSELLGKEAYALIDAVTGEIIKTEVKDIIQKGAKPNDLVNEPLSTEAPDGMISEAVAAAIALENSGLDEQCVARLKASLNGGVYKVSYSFGYDDFSETTSTWDYRTNTYEIDAVTGKILSFDALTPDDYIGEEAALAIAYELAGISEEDVESAEIKFDNSGMCYPQYIIVLYSDPVIYRYNLDAISGYDHIVR